MAADDSLVSWGPSPTYGELVRIHFVKFRTSEFPPTLTDLGKTKIFKYAIKVGEFESVGKNKNMVFRFEKDLIKKRINSGDF